MPRINIEDNEIGGGRFMRLVASLGDHLRALGALTLLKVTAQKHWCPGQSPIPREEWDNAGLPDALLTCGFAKETQGGILMLGVKTQFAWYDQRVQAGIASVAARIKDKMEPATVNGRSAAVNEPSTSSSSSSSSSFLNIQTSSSEEDLNGRLIGGKESSREFAAAEMEKIKASLPGFFKRSTATSRRAGLEPIADPVNIMQTGDALPGGDAVTVEWSDVVDNTEENIIDVVTGKARNGYCTSDKR